MNAILGKILHPVTITVLGILFAELVVYFGGTALREHGWLPRWFTSTVLILICVGIILLAVGIWFWRRQAAAKKAAAIEQQLRSQAQQQVETMRPDLRGDVEELQKQLDKAVGSLKNSRLGSGALYALPWYMIVGPPGSGKTTMLRESGLNFPDPEFGGRGLRGVGGTRNCDWWFTDQAILLDTAGRYATEVEDRDEWLSFLEMVTKARKKKPINGVIVAISIEDIVGASDSEVSEHAEKIRQRIDELNKELKLLFPIYLVFTKCDLLQGFVETFDGMDREERNQVWGYTIPEDSSSDEVHGQFEREFSVLYDRLCAHRLSLLAHERSVQKQQRVYSFPLQLSVARDKISEFVRLLAAPNPYREGAQLRGFYFTSGTQEGAPIDRVLGALRERLGLVEESGQAHDDHSEAKSYFIGDLFTDVLFPDQDLARSSSGVETRRIWLRRAGMAAIGLFSLYLLVRMFGTFFQEGALIEETSDVYKASLDLDAPAGKPSAATIDALDDLRENFEILHDNYRWDWLLGRSDDLYPHVRDMYIAKLKHHFLVPIATHLQDELTAWTAEGGDPNRIDRMRDNVWVYGTLCGFKQPSPRLADWIRSTDLWRWTDHGTPAPPSDAAPRLAHFRAFVERVALEPQELWQIHGNQSVYDEARRAVEKDAKGQAWRGATAGGGTGEKVEDFEVEDAVVDSEIRKALEDLGMPVTPENIETQKQLFRDNQLEVWNEKIAKTRIGAAADLNQAYESLDDWINERRFQALYREALTSLGKHDDTIPSPPSESAEIEGLDLAVEKLRDVLTAIVAFQQTGSRSDRVVEVVADNSVRLATGVAPLRAALRVARTPIDKEVSKLQVDKLRASFRTALRGVITDVENALRLEASDELQAYWNRNVGGDLVRFKQRFPFTEDDEEVRITEFQAMFAPETGKWAKALRLIAEIQSELNLELHEKFGAVRTKVEQLQTAMFVDGKMRVNFRVKLEPQGDATELAFVYSASENRDVDAFEGREQARSAKERYWSSSDRGAELTMKEAGGLNFAKSAPNQDSPWALFRLLGLADQRPEPDVEGAVRFTWSLKTRGDERQVFLTISPSKDVNPFTDRFFSSIVFPDSLFQG